MDVATVLSFIRKSVYQKYTSDLWKVDQTTAPPVSDKDLNRLIRGLASNDMAMQCKIRKIFFELLKKHFPKNTELHKIFNKNVIKLSYCCISNFETAIKRQNFKGNVQHGIVNSKKCNCRDKCKCPLDRIWKTEGVIYQVEVKDIKGHSKIYMGVLQAASRRDGINTSHVWELKEKITKIRL